MDPPSREEFDCHSLLSQIMAVWGHRSGGRSFRSAPPGASRVASTNAAQIMKWNRAPQREGNSHQQLNWKMQQIARAGCVSGETASSALRITTGARDAGGEV